MAFDAILFGMTETENGNRNIKPDRLPVHMVHIDEAHVRNNRGQTTFIWPSPDRKTASSRRI